MSFRITARGVAVAGATAAVIAGAGGAALAVTGGNHGTHASASATSARPACHHRTPLQRARHWRRLAERVVHGQIVVHRDGQLVTHDVAVGTVSAVSATSISVHTADGTTETFAVTPTTRVRTGVSGRGRIGSRATISQVGAGDAVIVAGTGATTFTAKHVIDRAG